MQVPEVAFSAHPAIARIISVRSFTQASLPSIADADEILPYSYAPNTIDTCLSKGGQGVVIESLMSPLGGDHRTHQQKVACNRAFVSQRVFGNHAGTNRKQDAKQGILREEETTSQSQRRF